MSLPVGSAPLSESDAIHEASGLTVAAVARRLGVAPATLRTWDRRYGVGPTDHRSGAHRRYTSADLARLEQMRRLMIAGVPLADAARQVKDQGAVRSQQSEPEAAGLQAVGPETRAEGRPGGGRVVAIPGGTPGSRGLARAAQSLDGLACRAIIDETIERRGVVWTWDHLLAPVLVGVGQQWQNSGRWIEVEHVLSEAVTTALSSAVRQTDTALGRPVLLAATQDEAHALPLWALAAALSERRIPARVLGARVPGAALIEAVHRTGPAAVFLWSQTSDNQDHTVLAQLPQLRPPVVAVVGGPGWTEPLPDGVFFVGDLTEAVARLARAAGE